MSVLLNTKGQIDFQNSADGATSVYIASLKCPTALAADRIINIPDAGAESNLMLGKRQVITAAAGDNALTVQQSGALVLLSTAAAGTQIQLPSIATSAGCYFDLVLHNATAGANCVVTITGTAADGMIGSLIVNAAKVSFTAGGSDSITFVSGTATTGDMARLYCTGSKWVCMGFAQVAGSITIQN